VKKTLGKSEEAVAKADAQHLDGILRMNLKEICRRQCRR
jgi:hypothetical protein